MSAIADSMGELIASMGLDPGRVRLDGHLALSVEGLGDLHFEEAEDELLMYLAREIQVDEDALDVQRKAMSLVHFHNVLPFPVQVARLEESLVMLTRIQAHDIDLPRLQRAVDLLGELQDKARA